MGEAKFFVEDKHSAGTKMSRKRQGKIVKWTYMRYYQVFLDVHKIVNADTSKFWYLLSTLLKEASYIVALLTLYAIQMNFILGAALPLSFLPPQERGKKHTLVCIRCPLPSQ